MNLTNYEIEKLTLEKDELQTEVKKLKAQLDTQSGPSMQSLKALIQDMRIQKGEADQEIVSLRHQLTLVTMEREKYMAILAARDRQIKEMQVDMKQLQESVNEQLMEIQRGPPSSVPSTVSTVTGKR